MRTFGSITLFVLVVLLVAGCGTSAISARIESKLDQVRESGQVRVGIRFDNPPLSYIDDEGNWVGFDVDLAKALVEEIGLEIEQVKVDETTRISFLQEDKIDMAVASMNAR